MSITGIPTNRINTKRNDITAVSGYLEDFLIVYNRSIKYKRFYPLTYFTLLA